MDRIQLHLHERWARGGRKRQLKGTEVRLITCPLVLTAAAASAAAAAFPSAATSPPLDALEPIVFECARLLKQIKKEKTKKKERRRVLIQPQGASKYPAVAEKRDEKSRAWLFLSSPSVKSAASTRCLPELGLVTPAERDPLKSTPVERKPFNVQQVQRRHQEAGRCFAGTNGRAVFACRLTALANQRRRYKFSTETQFDATISSVLLAKITRLSV